MARPADLGGVPPLPPAPRGREAIPIHRHVADDPRGEGLGQRWTSRKKQKTRRKHRRVGAVAFTVRELERFRSRGRTVVSVGAFSESRMVGRNPAFIERTLWEASWPFPMGGKHPKAFIRLFHRGLSKSFSRSKPISQFLQNFSRVHPGSSVRQFPSFIYFLKKKKKLPGKKRSLGRRACTTFTARSELLHALDRVWHTQYVTQVYLALTNG